MNTKFKNTIQLFALVPFFAIANQTGVITNIRAEPVRIPTVSSLFRFAQADNVPVVVAVEKDTRAARIDAYFARFNLPLTGYGAQFVAVADKYDLDWRLLPAIGMRETTGGKFACYNNPFGWGSCKIKFTSFANAIDHVGMHLGGEHSNTDQYYKNRTSEEKLHYYNGTVITTYVREVVKIMDRIEIQEI